MKMQNDKGLRVGRAFILYSQTCPDIQCYQIFLQLHTRDRVECNSNYGGTERLLQKHESMARRAI